MKESIINNAFMFKDFSRGLKVLKNAILSGAPYVLLRGKSGTGKTTLLRELSKSIDRRYFKILYLSHGQPTPDTIVRFLAEELRLPLRCSRAETGRLLVQAMRYKPERILLWIDEAQSFPGNTLQELRALAEADLDVGPIFSILFCSLPNIEDRLQYPDLYPLWRRINPKVTLVGLLHEEVVSYMKHLFGAEATKRFSSEAVATIFESASGIPAQVKSLSEQCLQHCEESCIEAEQVVQIMEDMDFGGME